MRNSLAHRDRPCPRLGRACIRSDVRRHHGRDRKCQYTGRRRRHDVRRGKTRSRDRSHDRNPLALPTERARRMPVLPAYGDDGRRHGRHDGRERIVLSGSDATALNAS